MITARVKDKTVMDEVNSDLLRLKQGDALIVVDVQNDFCPGGNLAVHDGDSVVPVVNHLASQFDLAVATQDWHPDNHVSFAKNHAGRSVYDRVEVNGISQVLWPTHCVAGTHGADLSSAQHRKLPAHITQGNEPRH